jgi:hypothetical protein
MTARNMFNPYDDITASIARTALAVLAEAIMTEQRKYD